jgi:membrane protease YdiL (CAAX protease family)
MHHKVPGNDVVGGRTIVKFLLAVAVLGGLAQLGAIQAGMAQGGQGWLLLAMWTPAMAAFAVSAASRRMAWAAFRRVGWRWLLPGLLVGLAPPLLKAALLVASGTATWDAAHFELTADGSALQAIHGVGTVLGAGPQGFGRFALNLLLSVTLGSVITAVIGGIGEELGWRGFLQPALERRFGAFRGTLLVGLIWAYWHLPVNLMGYNDAAHPALSALVLFPVAVVLMSFGLAWLQRRSGSAWPAALAHGANNTLGRAFLVLPTTWGAGATAETVAIAVVATAFVWASVRRQESRAGVAETAPGPIPAAT